MDNSAPEILPDFEIYVTLKGGNRLQLEAGNQYFYQNGGDTPAILAYKGLNKASQLIFENSKNQFEVLEYYQIYCAAVQGGFGLVEHNLAEEQ